MMPVMNNTSTEPGRADRVVRATRAVSIFCLLGLVVLGLAWELWLAPTGNKTLVLKVIPLLFPLIGLLKHRMYTHRWVSLLVWIYFTEGVVRASSDPYPSSLLAGIEVLLCLGLFTASALHVRWRLRRAAADATQAAAAAPGEAIRP